MKNSIFTAISCHYSDVPKRLNYETEEKENGTKKEVESNNIGFNDSSNDFNGFSSCTGSRCRYKR